MKSNREQRPGGDQTTRKSPKLDPIRKSGKERHEMYKSLDDDQGDQELEEFRRSESVLDYLDDQEEEEF